MSPRWARPSTPPRGRPCLAMKGGFSVTLAQGSDPGAGGEAPAQLRERRGRPPGPGTMPLPLGLGAGGAWPTSELAASALGERESGSVFAGYNDSCLCAVGLPECSQRSHWCCIVRTVRGAKNSPIKLLHENPITGLTPPSTPTYPLVARGGPEALLLLGALGASPWGRCLRPRGWGTAVLGRVCPSVRAAHRRVRGRKAAREHMTRP